MDHKPAGSGEAVLVRTALTYEGRQGLTYGEGVFAENTGARGLCLHVLRIPPGGRAKAHLHASHETAIYLIAGAVSVLHGQGLKRRTEMEAGDYLYIPADCPTYRSIRGASKRSPCWRGPIRTNRRAWSSSRRWMA